MRALVESTAGVHDGIGKIISYFPIEVVLVDGVEQVLMGLVQELGDATLHDRNVEMHNYLDHVRQMVESGDISPEHFMDIVEDCLLEILDSFEHLLDAIIVLDSNGVTHRDLKPINIVLVNGVWKIIDFGEARKLPQTVTNLSVFRGTEMYFPLVNHGRSRNHDSYSLGCIIYERLAGPMMMVHDEGALREKSEMAEVFRKKFCIDGHDRLVPIITAFAEVLSTMTSVWYEDPGSKKLECSVRPSHAKRMVAFLRDVFEQCTNY